MSLVIFPLVSIELQAQRVCEEWKVPYLSLDETSPESITDRVESMVEKPRVITTTISKVCVEEVQRSLRKLPVVTICIDEAQVIKLSLQTTLLNFHFRSSIVTLDRAGLAFSRSGLYREDLSHLSIKLSCFHSAKSFGCGLRLHIPKLSIV